MIRKYIQNIISRIKGESFYKEYFEINGINNEKKLRVFLEENLNKLLKHAYLNVPYYKHVFDEIGLIKNDIIDMSRFNKIPILTKEIIRNNFKELFSKDYSKRKWYYKETGGTTGEPIMILQDDTYTLWRNATEHYYYLNMLKIDKDSCKKIIIWGSWSDLFQSVGGTRAKISNWIKNTKFLNCLRMTEEDILDFIKTINSFKPDLIRGYSSSLYEMCRYAEKKNLIVHSPKVIIGAAETLTPKMRETIENVFSTKVYNFYGTREVSSIAGECIDGLMHIFSFHNNVEILDSEDKPVKTGEEGRVIVTNLHNYSMPLIRYEIEDLGVLGPQMCKCRNSLQTLKNVTGRVTDWFVKEDKTTISPMFFMYLFMGIHEKALFKQFQIIQEDYKKIRILIIPEKNKDESYKKFIEDKIKHMMGRDCIIIWEFVNEIPKTKSGKYVYIKSLLKEQK